MRRLRCFEGVVNECVNMYSSVSVCVCDEVSRHFNSHDLILCSNESERGLHSVHNKNGKIAWLLDATRHIFTSNNVGLVRKFQYSMSTI